MKLEEWEFREYFADYPVFISRFRLWEDNLLEHVAYHIVAEKKDDYFIFRQQRPTAATETAYLNQFKKYLYDDYGIALDVQMIDDDTGKYIKVVK